MKEGKYYLEDPTGTVELDLSNCVFHILQIVSGGKHNLLVPTCLPADMKICSTIASVTKSKTKMHFSKAFL